MSFFLVLNNFQLDKKVIEGVAFGDPAYAEKSMIKVSQQIVKGFDTLI